MKLAQNYYFNFLSQTIRYNLISKDFPERTKILNYFIEDKDGDDVKEENFMNWLKNVSRDLKIDRLQRIKRLRSFCYNFMIKQNKKNGDYAIEDDIEDSDEYFDCWISWINCCVLITLDRLGLLFREIELLDNGNSEDSVSINTSKNNNLNKNMKQNDKIIKFEKPFKLVRNRKQVADGVFQNGHNLPTMTINEYLDLEKRRGNIITGGGASSGIKKEIDEDDETVIEIELIKAREFDEYKDSKKMHIFIYLLQLIIVHSRGSGNTYNRS